MTILYNLFTSAVPLFLKLSSPFSKKISIWLEVRKNWAQKLTESKLIEGKCNIWFHCASLGEYEQGKPVMEAIKEAFPETSLIITFFSPSGYEARKHTPLAKCVTYLPLDSRSNAKEFIRLVNPKMAIFVKSEIWPNFISSLKERNVPLFLISARFHEGQSLFKKRGSFFRSQLKKFDFLFVQDKASQKLLKKHEIYSLLAGDTRFDQVSQLPLTAPRNTIVEHFLSKQLCLVIGSCWEQDLEVLIPYIELAQGKVKIIVAPHDVGEDMVAHIFSKIKTKGIRYTEMQKGKDYSSEAFMVLDCIGVLATLYKYADVAYIGGAFKQGLHNILEPASFGVPVVFGPQITGFPEASEMLKEAGAYRIANAKDLTDILADLFGDQSTRRSAGERNKLYVSSKTGATEKIMSNIRMLLTPKFEWKN